ncbi:reverse transcriptase domain-containing protein [Tanacetum coccineum]|uniref:Reverse transcriptase domain-containing protein n=1 Tax=Tanacetum coccineum TaxID=301880 RepID=A0ABQ5GV19_9ASTR
MRLKKHEEMKEKNSRVYVKCKANEENLRREKMLEGNEALDEFGAEKIGKVLTITNSDMCNSRTPGLENHGALPFLLGRKEIAMIPSGKKKSQVPMAEVKLEENILETKVVEDDVEKIQDLHICEQHDNKVSTLLLETTKEVGVLKSCGF